MKITIHRGTDQIGGCVTEYEYDGWKLFVDYGEQLPEAPKSDKPLEIEGLTQGDLSRSALLITHYHGDHIEKLTSRRHSRLLICARKLSDDEQIDRSVHSLQKQCRQNRQCESHERLQYVSSCKTVFLHFVPLR